MRFFLALAVLPMMPTTTGLLRALRPALGQDAAPQIERGLTRAMRSILTGLHGARARGNQAANYTHTRLWLVALGLAVVGVVVGALTLTMIAVGPLLGHTRDFAPGASSMVAGAWPVLRRPVAVGIVVGYVLLVHRAGLRRSEGRPSRRAALAGAAFTTVGAAVASLLLPVYVHVAGLVSPTIGALGGGLILLLWTYLIMVSLILGAQLRVRLGSRPTSPGSAALPQASPSRTGAVGRSET